MVLVTTSCDNQKVSDFLSDKEGDGLSLENNEQENDVVSEGPQHCIAEVSKFQFEAMNRIQFAA